MTRPQTITTAQVPAPDTLIDYGNGNIGPLMFHWMPEGADFEGVAKEAGFEMTWTNMSDDLKEDDPVYVAYFENGDGNVLSLWHPAPPDGYTLAAKYDTEDGPQALFLRRKGSR